MKAKLILAVVSIISLLGCNNNFQNNKPHENALAFFNNGGIDSLELLADSTEVLSLLEQWRNQYKDLTIKSTSDKNIQIKKVSFHLTSDVLIKLDLYFLGSKLFKLEAFPFFNFKPKEFSKSEEDNALWDSLINFHNDKYTKHDDNRWEMKNKFLTSTIFFERNYTNSNNSSDSYNNHLTKSADFQNAFPNYRDEINEYLNENHGTGFFIDFRDGTVKVPGGKIWVVRKSENLVADNKSLGVFDTSRVCQCVFKGAMESTTYTIINGKCIHLGSLAPPYERSILPPCATICTPNASVLNGDNGKREYIYVNNVVIEQFNFDDIPYMQELSTYIRGFGFIESDYQFVEYINALTAIEKKEIE